MSATQCVKWTMFIFNFLFFVMGCAMLGVGIWLKVDKDDYVEISKYDYITAANILIAAGIIIMVVAFLGCCGAAKEISSLLLVFFILMLIIFILEIAAGGYAYAKRDELQDDLSAEFNKSIQEDYGKPDHDGLTTAIDKFQESFDCCGYNNYLDWKGSAFNLDTGAIPKSCCINQNNCDNKGTLDIYYKKGCFKEVEEFLKDNFIYIAGCAVAFAVIQILGMVFAMYLYCEFRSGRGTLA